MTELSVLQVLLPTPLNDLFSYRIGEGCAIPSPGELVEAPFGSRRLVGVVWEIASDGGVDNHNHKPAAQNRELKTAVRIDNAPSFPNATRAFLDWVAEYTLASRGLLLNMAFGGHWRQLKDKDLKLLAEWPVPDVSLSKCSLTAQQQAAVAQINATPYAAVSLLDGVTGSGKTEVYVEALSKALSEGKQALLLVPEIALTASLGERLKARFGIMPTMWHSGLTETVRRRNWHAIARGNAKLILGARSALFLPYQNLGVIVVDEEHEGAYKQDEGAIYNGRDMAVVRGQIGQIPVVLVSATPSLETLHNVTRRKWRHVKLRERYGEARLPGIRMIDMRGVDMPKTRFISPQLQDVLQKKLAAGEQAMLFLNRRGYAPLSICRSCGHRMACPDCASWLVLHRTRGVLICHHCGYSLPEPQDCPACSGDKGLAACGPGVERIAEEVALNIPQAKAALVTSDTLSTVDAVRKLIDDMNNGAINILIGTQMMAKAWHFPRLTTVGVIDADMGLGGVDPRASERSFQMLQQVAGRSGREELPGQVLVQTTCPDHPVMQALASGDRDAFLKAEMHERASWELPPFTRLATLTISGTCFDGVEEGARLLAMQAPHGEALRTLGPAPPPLARLRGRYRQRFILRAARSVNISQTMRSWLASVKLPRTLRLHVDVDPVSFL